MTKKETSRSGFDRLVTPVTDIFGLSRTLAILVLIGSAVALGFAIYWFVHSAPPRTMTITAGPPGSSFATNAEQYVSILASNRVKLIILPSQGSEENLKRLNDPNFKVDAGFVQGGVTNGLADSKLVSLGSINYAPLFVFYRGSNNAGLFSQFIGKRLAIGPEGSGTHALALALLNLNGMTTNGNTTLLDWDADRAEKGLLDGTLDAAFMMGDSASTQIMRELLHSPEIHLFSVAQADGFTRRISYLTKLNLPMGSLDFGKNIPGTDVQLVGPTVEILARPSLHPALCDLLLEAARLVNGKSGLLKRKNEFPAPLEHDYPISDEATRFYGSGKKFLYQHFPFWLASLVNGILVSFVPLVLVLIPAMKAIPALYKWRVRMLIYKRYRALLTVERDLVAIPKGRHDELLVRLDSIQNSVNRMKVPASFADQFYSLRGHIDFVRNRLVEPEPPAGK